MGEQQNTTKARLGRKDALALAKKAKRILSARGKNVFEIDVARDEPTEAELEKAILGPTGNLRAPAMRVGNTLVVGFHPGMNDDLLR